MCKLQNFFFFNFHEKVIFEGKFQGFTYHTIDVYVGRCE